MENAIDIDKLKFPIGTFQKKDEYSVEQIASLIADIEKAPSLYREIASGLSSDDLNKSYRPGSWNIRQLIHHVADIQLLHYFRMKKALTEPDGKEAVLINMDDWAKTPDSLCEPIEDSLITLDGLTKRYVYIMRALTEKELAIEYFHPVRKTTFTQAQAIAISAWHLKHHLAHIKIALGIE